MPTPAGHTLAALAAGTWSRPLSRHSLADPWLWLAILSANAADLDFLPGVVLGNESLFHRGASHSIGGAMLFGAAVFALALVLSGSGRTASRALLLSAGLYGGHLLLDFFGRDPGPPYGIQLFWPLSVHYYPAPAEVFPHLDRHPFDLSVVRRAVPVVAVEAALLGPVVLLADRLARRRERLLEQGRSSR